MRGSWFSGSDNKPRRSNSNSVTKLPFTCSPLDLQDRCRSFHNTLEFVHSAWWWHWWDAMLKKDPKSTKLIHQANQLATEQLQLVKRSRKQWPNLKSNSRKMMVTGTKKKQLKWRSRFFKQLWAVISRQAILKWELRLWVSHSSASSRSPKSKLFSQKCTTLFDLVCLY